MALPFDTIKQEALNLEDLSDAENERLWLDEAERRQAEVREGRVAMVPGDEVMEQLNQSGPTGREISAQG